MENPTRSIENPTRPYEDPTRSWRTLRDRRAWRTIRDQAHVNGGHEHRLCTSMQTCKRHASRACKLASNMQMHAACCYACCLSKWRTRAQTLRKQHASCLCCYMHLAYATQARCMLLVLLRCILATCILLMLLASSS